MGVLTYSGDYDSLSFYVRKIEQSSRYFHEFTRKKALLDRSWVKLPTLAAIDNRKVRNVKLCSKIEIRSHHFLAGHNKTFFCCNNQCLTLPLS